MVLARGRSRTSGSTSRRPGNQVCDDSRGPEWTTWFVGATLSIARNCVHRWAERDPDRVARRRAGEDGSRASYTFAELSSQVTRLAEGLVALGVEPGDRVAIYMPMCPEVAVASHACAHIGAVQVPLFSGFAAPAVRAAAARLGGEGRHHRRLVAAARRAARRCERPWTRRRARPRPSSTSSPGTGTPARGRGRRARPGRARPARGRLRASVPPHLHLGHDREAEGRAARPGRLPRLDRPRGRLPGRRRTPTTSSTSPRTWAGSWARGPSSAAARWAATLVFAEGAPDFPADRLWRSSRPRA